MNPDDLTRLKEIFASPTHQMVVESQEIPDWSFVSWMFPDLMIDRERRIAEMEQVAFVYNSVPALLAELERLQRREAILRQYGNKDCTAMADEEIAAEELNIS